MGLRDFFTKSSSNNTALDMSNEVESKKLEIVHDSTKQWKRERLPNALRTVGSASAALERQREAGSIFKLRQRKEEPTPPTHDEIAARAWQIWQEKGCHDGGDVENWLEAEAQLRAERK